MQTMVSEQKSSTYGLCSKYIPGRERKKTDLNVGGRIGSSSLLQEPNQKIQCKGRCYKSLKDKAIVPLVSFSSSDFGNRFAPKLKGTSNGKSWHILNPVW